jgi:hypothetical protein
MLSWTRRCQSFSGENHGLSFNTAGAPLPTCVMPLNLKAIKLTVVNFTVCTILQTMCNLIAFHCRWCVKERERERVYACKVFDSSNGEAFMKLVYFSVRNMKIPEALHVPAERHTFHLFMEMFSHFPSLIQSFSVFSPLSYSPMFPSSAIATSVHSVYLLISTMIYK